MPDILTRLASPPAKLLLVYIIFFVLAISYFHRTSARDPTSYFFDPDRAYERQYTSQRIAEAEAFLNTNSSRDTPHKEPHKEGEGDPALCMGIISVRRRGEQYVGLTVATMLDEISETERAKMKL